MQYRVWCCQVGRCGLGVSFRWITMDVWMPPHRRCTRLPLPGGDHQSLCVAVSPVPAEFPRGRGNDEGTRYPGQLRDDPGVVPHVRGRARLFGGPGAPTGSSLPEGVMCHAVIGYAGCRQSRVGAGREWWALLCCDDASGQSPTALATCVGCAASWRGIGRAHCRACHVTFDDEVLCDAHRLSGICVPPGRLDLVAVGGVWCRLLARGQAVAVVCPARTWGRRHMS
jgi:hypothetical protein